MPKDKDLKRRVRERMEKTGESYTTARSQLLRKQPPPLPDDYAAIAGQTDETIRGRTGKDWPAWVRVLDDIGATEMSHTEIARWMNEQTGLGWWSQAVTVGYERLRGLRDVGQRRGGGYEANRSRTINAPVSALFEALTDEVTRRRWLDHDLHIRGARPDRSVRIDWPDGTDVVIWLDAKSPEKTAVSVQHGKLDSAGAKESARAFWAERLAALKSLLE